MVEGEGIFRRGEKVAIGASGGKGECYFCKQSDGQSIDSTVLAHVLSLLNQRYDYGLDLFLLSIDEGITGYRDDSLEVRVLHVLINLADARDVQTVKENQVEYGLPLKILSYNELYGWTMDKIVEQVGRRNNCASYDSPST